MLCLACLLLAVSTESAERNVQSASSKDTKVTRGKRNYWGPQNFLGMVRARRSEIDNHLETFPRQPDYEVSPEAAAVGESIMEEFLMFLTLKETGLLDLCTGFKR